MPRKINHGDDFQYNKDVFIDGDFVQGNVIEGDVFEVHFDDDDNFDVDCGFTYNENITVKGQWLKGDQVQGKETQTDEWDW